MKARTLLIGTAFVLGVTGARAQWVVRQIPAIWPKAS